MFCNIETFVKQCYNIYMINLGNVSTYSAYTGQTNSVYGTAQTPDVKNNQKSSVAENVLPQDDIEDTATISDEAMKLLANDKSADAEKLPAEKKTEAKAESNDKKTSKSEGELTQEEQQEVAQLKARDAEVRAHEQAHIAAAVGISVSAPSYTYQAGPDGKKYAVGGEVSISFSSSGDPEQDIQNAETMKNAALAPAEPSGQDRSVAKNAEKIIQEAKEKLSEQQDQQKEEIVKSEPEKIIG